MAGLPRPFEVPSAFNARAWPPPVESAVKMPGDDNATVIGNGAVAAFAYCTTNSAVGPVTFAGMTADTCPADAYSNCAGVPFTRTRVPPSSVGAFGNGAVASVGGPIPAP